MMRTLLILTAIIGLSASAFAQTAAPKGGKPVKQPKPSAPMGCKLVGTAKGTKLWPGDCAAPSEQAMDRDPRVEELTNLKLALATFALQLDAFEARLKDRSPKTTLKASHP